jgi:hypothetical protein
MKGRVRPYERSASSGKSLSKGVVMVKEVCYEAKTNIEPLLRAVMSIVLPGQHVPAQHVNLKLGPGLLQTTGNSSGDASTSASIIATRAGFLNHSANGSKWWVENNSRRVCGAFFYSEGLRSMVSSMSPPRKNR